METSHPLLETFNKYLEIIETNIIRASIYLRLHRKIEEYLNQQKASGNQVVGGMFLAEARTAFSQTGMLLLAKVYDKNKDSVSLEKTLKCAESNNKYWPLTDTARRKFQADLISDKQKVDEKQSALVTKLVTFRDKVIAHPGNDNLRRDRRVSEILKDSEPSEETGSLLEALEELDSSEEPSPLSTILWNFLGVAGDSFPYPNFPHYLNWDEIDGLIGLAIEICSKYKCLANSDDEAEMSLNSEIESGVQELFANFEELCEKHE